LYLSFLSDWNAIDEGDSAFVEASIDGSNWNRLLTYDSLDVRNQLVFINLSAYQGQQTFWLRFVSVQPGWDWWWVIDDIEIGTLPVELRSFTALLNEMDVILNWQTATEVNNRGFEVQRRSGEEFVVIGFVEGNGSSTEEHSYNFIDKNISTGKQVYRLKQIDFDGAFEYSSEVEVEITSPKEYVLEQNYPNPFNPSTRINYSLASDAKVTLKVYDVLGQEVATLLNKVIDAGKYEITFNASNLNSGVYFYTIEARGVDGTHFISTRKMILTK
jgi:hypothetical protein